ncbi:hypothetical protein FM037_01880 [Shewanella psychropiezotolerans]|uniref:MSHA biogenesis protein MshF n=1 Tax=Shewanella psychropiezotolerans TaxID=2593655 RepID=A0ABX5WSZ3_9GAMM|nr:MULTISPECIES: hypothetical protein [Shewanella]MPY25884.1 hypothetical protein [Shewanella sp. YLB-07]QDO82212.1 hypothetical protein FM037_01880 [Shewanella psychropiezotolerans]
MLSQQKADGELLELYGKMIAIVLLLALLGVLGFRYFGSVNNIAAQGLRIDHTRFLNVLGMIKAQWLAQGRPKEMRLDWDTGSVISVNNQVTELEEMNLVKMSSGGWPLPNKLDSAGCEQLWYRLLGLDTASQQVVSSLSQGGDVCSYVANNLDRLGYQLTTGRVIFLTNDKE